MKFASRFSLLLLSLRRRRSRSSLCKQSKQSGWEGEVEHRWWRKNELIHSKSLSEDISRITHSIFIYFKLQSNNLMSFILGSLFGCVILGYKIFFCCLQFEMKLMSPVNGIGRDSIALEWLEWSWMMSYSYTDCYKIITHSAWWKSIRDVIFNYFYLISKNDVLNVKSSTLKFRI